MPVPIYLTPPLLRHSLYHFSKPLFLSPLLLRRRHMTTTTTTTVTAAAKAKSRRDSPESLLKRQLDLCSKHNDLSQALALYDHAKSLSTPLSLPHYNALLYLCSQSYSRLGFDIFREMEVNRISPNEATFTSLARLAAGNDDPGFAFELVKKMKHVGIAPKLRSYGPALFGFCRNGDAERAYEVERHMEECGVVPEDAELGALVAVSSEAGREREVYRLLQRMRGLVRQVSEETAGVVERWFGTVAAGEVGVEEWDERKVREGVVRGGGGWHGQGWLGKGKWDVGRTTVDESGVCGRCGERLVCIDIDPLETENFARSLSNLACQREVKAEFVRFQEWLNQHGPYDAVIDGANVGLYKQTNFSFFQINNVVKEIREMSSSKIRPLIILHTRRAKGGPADNPKNKKLIENWRRSGMLYTTPVGSNDDWYWLYAAVSCKSLLVTNDEMRDHLFQLLGDSFFPRWKEKHQVRLTFSRQGPKFHMPPPYSIVIQESETGSWHIPTVTGDDVESPRQWVCATRAPLIDSLVYSVHSPVAEIRL